MLKIQPEDSTAEGLEYQMQTVVIDERRWHLEFSGFRRLLEAWSADGESFHLRLEPWTFERHMAALRRSLAVAGARLVLDAEGYADTVLREAETLPVQATARRQCRALALWWASGFAPDPEPEVAAAPGGEGWFRLDAELWADLRAWTWGERLAARQQHLRADGAQLEFDPVGYLEKMVESCLRRFTADPASGLQDCAVHLRELDARATRRLLSAVVSLNHPDAANDPLSALSPIADATTLLICSALGWPLSKVLATPAAEIECLRLLINRVSGGARAALHRPSTRDPHSRRRTSVADHPDAVVFRFVDDEGAIA